MFEKRYRWDEVPSIGGPGVYAYFADTPDALLPVALGPGNLVYVGMTGASLKGRNHFDHEDSGFSSPRRSLGAILKDRLGLSAIPRSGGRSERNIDCYRFARSGEATLTGWMRHHLRMAVEPLAEEIRATEKSLIACMQPPLCLTDWANPQAGLIKELRKRCKAEARLARQASLR
jgi:hypothetical protein